MSLEKAETRALWTMAKPLLTGVEAFDPIVSFLLCNDDVPSPAFRR